MKSISNILRTGVKTDSPIEELLYREFLEYDLIPEIQHQVEVFFIDLAFPEIKLAIEADGRQWHSTKEQKERDKYREEKLKKLDWKFERFTGSFIFHHKNVAVAKIALKYFREKLTKKQDMKANGVIITYFLKRDNRIAMDILNSYEDGYYFDEKLS